MTADPVRLEVSRHRARLLLDRPDRRNALDEACLHALLRHTETLRRASQVRLVEVTSTSSVFSAGADLHDWSDATPERAASLSRLGNAAFDAVATLTVPTLAVIDGVAVGGGLELALACDVRVASSRSRLGFPEARLGSLPSWGGVPRLVATIGDARARHLLLTCELLDGDRAAVWGLVGSSVPAGQLAAEAERLSHGLLESDPTIVALTKDLLSENGTAGLEAALAARTAATESSRDRKHAFLHRRSSSAMPSPSLPSPGERP